MLYIVLTICFIVLLIATATYPKWSMKEYENRCKINSKYPDWYPKCGINFFEKDPQWFIDNGYEKYVKNKK